MGALRIFDEFPNFLWPMPREFWFLVKNWPFSKYMSIWCSIWCIWLHVARAPLECSLMVASFPKYSRMLALTLAERRTLRLLVHMIHMMISPWGKWNLRRLQMVFGSEKQREHSQGDNDRHTLELRRRQRLGRWRVE